MNSERPSVPTYGLYGEKQPEKPDFWIHVETIESRSRLHDFEIRQHRHDLFFQILYLQHGYCDVVLEDETWMIQPHSIILMPKDHSHGFRFSADVEGFVFTLLSARLPHVLNRVSPLQRLYQRPMKFDFSSDQTHPHSIFENLDLVAQDVMAGRPDNQELAFSAINMIFILLERMLPRDGHLTLGQLALNARFEKLQALLQQTYRQHLPVSNYASQLGVSVTHLNRISRLTTDKSVGELLSDIWIQEARRHLVFTAMSVKQIAFELGFSDPAYFSRFFTRETGISPKEYRVRERADLKNQVS